MKLDVLAFGAHPDDVELSCGGTLAKLAKHGKAVGIVDLTRGEMGTRGTPDRREAEAAEAARILGVAVRENLGIPDGNIELTPANTLKVVQVIRKYRPDVILIPHWLERHPDHEHTHQLCRKAWFSAGLEKVETTVLGVLQDPFRPRAVYHYMQWYEFTPSFVVDISEEFEQRMQAVRAFASQFYNPQSNERETALSSPEFLRFMETRFAYYGSRIGRRYGEPFYSINIVGISDLFALTS